LDSLVYFPINWFVYFNTTTFDQSIAYVQEKN
jgi:hypothetical protein